MEFLGGIFFLIILVLGLINLVAIVWAIVDIVKRPTLSQTEKIIWVIVVLLLELLGVLIYVIAGRK